MWPTSDPVPAGHSLQEDHQCSTADLALIRYVCVLSAYDAQAFFPFLTFRQAQGCHVPEPDADFE